MNTSTTSLSVVETSSSDDGTAPTHYDTVVIGAGFGGLRMLHEARKLGLSVKVLEAGSDVGGTWYWNRYPGARTDTEAWAYIMSFSEELKTDWVWSERYPAQAEVERYLKYVTERFDMRRDIQFHTRVTSAVYDEAANLWTIITEAGQSFTCTYFVSASGVLSAPWTRRSLDWTLSLVSGTRHRVGRRSRWTSPANESRWSGPGRPQSR